MMPYICLARTDIPDGQVQILDLKPNSSQRSLIYEPEGQTRYVNRVENAGLVFTATGATHGNTDGLSAYLVDRVEPAGGSWTPANQATVSAGLLNRLDAGLALALADVNTVIQVTFGGSDLDGAGSNSTGVLTELLSILSGRGYRLGAGFIKGPGGVWDATQRGAFTETVLVNDTVMIAGEWRPVNIGGDPQQREVKGIRHTVETGDYLISLATGDLAHFNSAVNTLFPDSDQVPRFPWAYQKGAYFAPAVNVRVVTVYNDDGSLA
jgi:hypothetical protein